MSVCGIIPEPKRVVVGEVRFVLSSLVKCFVFGASEEALYAVELLREEIEARSGVALSVEPKESRSGGYSMVLAGNPLESEIRNPKSYGEGEIKREGYRLTVTSERVVLSASDASGFFYGVQSLIQLAGYGSPISFPCREIEDWPDLEIRGIHLNLWSMMPTYAYLEDFIKRLSRFKINTILLEYEDKFPYEKHSVLRHELALSKEEIESLLRVAKAHHVEVIPLVQCLGHLAYVLKHKEYAHLAEKADPAVNPMIGRDWQYCPLNPASLKMFQDMASEVMEVHGDSRFFHVGGDETFFLGQCDRCRAFVEQHGVSRLFVETMNKVGAFVKGKGKIPVLWYDYLTNFPKDVDRLSRDFWIMYWEYRMGSRSVPFVRWAGLEFSGRQIADQFPEYILEIFREYWDGGEFPEKIKGFPYIRYFQDKGFEVLGAARYQGDWRMRVPNTTAFCEALSEEGARGMVNTHWPGNTLYPLFYGGGEPLEVSWLPILTTAEAAWSPGRVSREAFDRKFASVFLGTQADALVRSMYLMGGIINTDTAAEVERKARQCLTLLAEVRDEANVNRLFLDHIKWAARVRAAQARRVVALKEVEVSILSHVDRKGFARWQVSDVSHWTGALSPGTIPEGLEKAGVGISELDTAIGELAGLRREIVEIKAESRRVLRLTLREEEVEALLDRPLVGEKEVGEYLGQLQMIRTCLMVEAYFRENFV